MTTADTPKSIKDPKKAALLRARYRAESRYRLYGIASLVVSVLFLLSLLSNIFTTAWPAFWSHSLNLDVPLSAELIDPEGKKSPEVLAAADYNAVARAALAAEFPGVEGRVARKDLNGILSSGAGDSLRDMVVANPALIGQTVKANLLMSDDADLYLKGVGTAISRFPGTRGIANPSAASGEVTVLTASNDFAPFLLDIKKALAERAAKLRDEADALERRSGAESAERVAAMRAEAVELQKRYDAPSADETLDGNLPSILAEINGGIVKATKLSASSISGETLIPLKSTDAANPGSWSILKYDTPESARMVSDRKVALLDKLESAGKVEKSFNWLFFTAGDSREPELAGIRGAVVGSVLTLLVTLGLCLPIGVLAAIYLEEFAPKNRLTDFIEININNLAAVPSIVFGLLGLAVFLNFFGMPRSAPLVGGLVLALLVLPTIIIAARAALKAVPPSIREGALGVGASKQQAIFHHVLPLALPGIMTGSIIGMAHALGETAPLLMIGMVAFIVDVPQAITEAATVMPVQIYLWSDLPEPAFQYKTAAAITVLLMILFLMNGTAIWLRKKFERRW
jgi:phosphate transport system permease protein